MRAKLSVSAPAVADLEHIRDHLGNEASPEIAATQLRRIAAALRWLREYPKLGQLGDQSLRRKSVLKTPYIIFYRIAGDTVRVIRIRHSREDWRSTK